VEEDLQGQEMEMIFVVTLKDTESFHASKRWGNQPKQIYRISEKSKHC
jgi:hypothetical protein